MSKRAITCNQRTLSSKDVILTISVEATSETSVTTTTTSVWSSEYIIPFGQISFTSRTIMLHIYVKDKQRVGIKSSK